jgi:HK97 family phage portal protein
MKIISTVKNWLGINAATTTDTKGWFVDFVRGGGPTASGVAINNDSALKIGTVYACINRISSDIAKVPFHIYKQAGDRKEKQYDHPLHALLNRRPNPEIKTAITFRRMLQSHALGWGNAYCEIERDIYGRPLALWPLHPSRCQWVRDESNNLRLEYTDEKGKHFYIKPENVFNVLGLSPDGITGYNVIRYAKECLGAATAAEIFGAKFFGSGANPGGVYEAPGPLSPKAYERLKADLSRNVEGLNNAQRTLILEEGLKFSKLTIPPEEAQFLETRQFSVPEICRWFGMKPHKVGDLSRATFSNIEQQALEYVGDTLLDWYVLWEQTVDNSLLSDEERAGGFYTKHNINGLLRGDIDTRYRAYNTGIQAGFLTRNEVREWEDLNPEDGLDEFLQPLNMVPAGTLPEQLNNPGKPDNSDEDAIIEDAAGRIARAELREVEKHLPKSKDDILKFAEWSTRFYDVKHRAYVEQTIKPFAGGNSSKMADAIISMCMNTERTTEQGRIEDIKAIIKQELK